jgi:uncharacterized repeat protein (TIGR01451 family)/LPXTG-motif cell wall-anchored protein
MLGLSNIKAISNRFKNFLLAMAFVATQLAVPLTLSGSAMAAGAITFGSQFENQVYPDNSNDWATGQLDNYSEGDYVNFRFQLTASDATSAGVMQIEYDLGSCNFFTNYFNLVSETPNIVNISKGTNTLNGSGNGQYYAQKLNVNFSSAGTTTVIFTLQLSNTAGECSGSNTGVRLNVPSTGDGDFGNVGAKTLPMSANQVLENPSLTITKTVASGDASPDDFYFTVSPAVSGIINGVSATWSEIHLTNGTVTINEVNPDGQFVITEHGPAGYSFEGGTGTSCNVTDSNLGVMTATVTADNDNPVDATCNFANTRSMGTLKVLKNVINDNGGTKTYQNFGFKVGDGSEQSFNADVNDTHGEDGVQTLSLPTGTYSVTEPEANTMGYATSYSNCTDVMVVAGQTATCTITNDDQPATLTVNKVVVNDNGGTKHAQDFQFKVNAGTATNFEADGSNTQTVNAGNYNVTEVAASGYGTTYSGCSDIVLTNGGSATCTITNNDIAPTLTLRKVVLNPYGGTGIATANLWTLRAQHESDSPLINMVGTLNNDASASTTSTTATAGMAYDLSESGPSGYSASGWSCDGGTPNGSQVTLGLAQNVTCTITNTQQPASISGYKYEVDARGNGTTPVASWTVYLLVSGNPITSAPTDGSGYYQFTGLAWGDYTLAECLNVSDGCASWTQISTPPAVTVNGNNLTSDNNNFGNFKNGSISGYKWNDANGDGNVTGDQKLAGWTITLTGTTNAGDAVSHSMATDVNGNYDFPNLAPGTYTICEVLQPGWVQTYPGDPSAAECHNATIDDSNENLSGESYSFGNQARGTIKVIKDVVNDNGNTGTYQDFSFRLSSSDVFDSSVDKTGGYSFDQAGADPNDGAKTIMQVPAGTYNVTEPEANTMGYNTSYSGCATIVVTAGQTATCTITNDDNAASLTLNKVVKEDNGGMAPESAWTLNAVGNSQNPTNLSGPGAAGSTDVVSGSNFKADTYTLSETGGPAGYAASAWTCTNGVTVNGNNQITLTNGQTTVCTITNDDIAPTLTLKKVVVNDNGGKATQANFQATENTTAVDWDTATTATAGANYALDETVLPGGEGYSASSWTCDGGTLRGNQVVLGLDEDVTCTIINDDIAPQLTVYKFVDNQDTNLTKTPGNFTMNVDGSDVSDSSFAGSDSGVTVTLKAGDFTVTEDADSEYTVYYYNCTGTIKVGESKTCYVHNTAVRNPAIHVEKDGPSSAYAGDTVTYTFTVTNPGNVPLSGPTVSDDVAGNGAKLQSGDVSNPGWLDPGETWIYTVQYKIPTSQKGDVVNTVTACGEPNFIVQITEGEFDGSTDKVCDTDTHTMRILHVLGTSTELPNTGQGALLNFIAGAMLILLALGARLFGRKSQTAAH